MTGKSMLVTGSSGFIGSQCVRHFDQLGWEVHGIDNNMRIVFLGPAGDAAPVTERLIRDCRRFHAHDIDIRFRDGILELMRDIRPSLIVHCAAQSAQVVSKDVPFDDFDTNATGTMNVLEAVRRFSAESPFIFLSTNRVYGDAPNELPLTELETRWDYAHPEHREGIDESCRIDASLHTLYGASKAAADLLVQEYGRYFNVPAVCLRASSISGPQEIGTEPHGFLAYLARCIRDRRPYRIYGHQGKQVRDILHAQDLCEAIGAIYASPRAASVYNLGGGRANSVSVLEAIAAMEEISGYRLQTESLEESRKGDPICYISDTRKFRHDFPAWTPRHSLAEIIRGCLAQPATGTAESVFAPK
ncbi:MAG: NAD-dependent epimerase/dehydratase family protein [Terriglobales bacterium]